MEVIELSDSESNRYVISLARLATFLTLEVSSPPKMDVDRPATEEVSEQEDDLELEYPKPRESRPPTDPPAGPYNSAGIFFGVADDLETPGEEVQPQAPAPPAPRPTRPESPEYRPRREAPGPPRDWTLRRRPVPPPQAPAVRFVRLWELVIRSADLSIQYPAPAPKRRRVEE